jgi:hypothetical protein
MIPQEQIESLRRATAFEPLGDRRYERAHQLSLRDPFLRAATGSYRVAKQVPSEAFVLR